MTGEGPKLGRRSVWVGDLEPGMVLLTGAEVATVEDVPATRFRRAMVKVTFTDGSSATVGIYIRVWIR